MNILNHYRKLLYFNFNRLKGDAYREMREYLAQVFIADIGRFMSLDGKRVLDVGGARGEFCKALSDKSSCAAVNLDPAPFEYGKYSGDFLWQDTVLGSADKMPFEDNEFDLVMCLGAFEHISSAKQQDSLNEMFRVTRPGGLCYVTIPPWFNPTAGHGLKPFHYFPFPIAKRLSEMTYGKKIEASSWAEKKLFPVTFQGMSKMISASGFRVIDTQDRHLRMHFLTRIPVLREVAVPAVAFILRKF